MPASPSFPSENRTKWRRKPKRESQIGRRHYKHHRDDDEDEEDNEEEDRLDRDDDSDDQSPPNSVEIEAVSADGIQISQFPAAIKRAVTCPPSSVAAIVALERAIESGDRNGQLQHQNVPVLENVSHGQLQALSRVPADSPALDQDRGDGSNSSCVIVPPPILEGPGVVKRFGNRVLVVPMHSGSYASWFALFVMELM